MNDVIVRDADLIGRSVQSEGQEWMIVAFRGKWVVLENEDERTKQITRALAIRMIRGIA
jgi:hypothetical protein